MTQSFNRKKEHQQKPCRVSGLEHCRRGEARERWLAAGGIAGSDSDPVRRNGMKRKSSLFRLSYWNVRKSDSFIFLCCLKFPLPLCTCRSINVLQVCAIFSCLVGSLNSMVTCFLSCPDVHPKKIWQKVVLAISCSCVPSLWQSMVNVDGLYKSVMDWQSCNGSWFSL